MAEPERDETTWGAERRETAADWRDEIAAGRDTTADARDAIADERDRLADEREVEMDARERHVEARAQELGVPFVHTQEEADRIAMQRRYAQTLREAARQQREARAVERATASAVREDAG